MSAFTARAKLIGRAILDDTFIKNPEKIGDLVMKMLTVMYKLDLYEASRASIWYTSMPDGWRLLARDLRAYFNVVRKSRKLSRKQHKVKSNRNRYEKSL